MRVARLSFLFPSLKLGLLTSSSLRVQNVKCLPELDGPFFFPLLSIDKSVSFLVKLKRGHGAPSKDRKMPDVTTQINDDEATTSVVLFSKKKNKKKAFFTSYYKGSN